MPRILQQFGIRRIFINRICKLSFFDWVIANASKIHELILLGDIVDFWTYPADEEPPSFAAIQAANPDIFGQDGCLSRALTALKGRVTYVRGNHDITITQADLDLIPNPDYKVKLHPDDVYFPLGDDKRIVCTHGHLFTLFNAPPLHPTPIAPLPVGYYVPRAVATWRSRQMPIIGKPNVAWLPDSGDPDGMETLLIESTILDAVQRQDISVTQILLEAIAAKTGLTDNQLIRLPQGRTTTLAEAKQNYSNLFTEWMVREGDPVDGLNVAFKAVLADAKGGCN